MAARLLFASVLVAAPLRALAQPHVIDSVAEDLHEGGPETHDDKGGCRGINENVSAPIRAGRYAFKHTVRDCAERAEIGMEDTETGGTYWLGWSLFVPEEYEETSKGNIFAQWAAYPPAEHTRFPCRGVGHKMEVNGGWLEYHLQGFSN